jgi:ribosomal protein L40E
MFCYIGNDTLKGPPKKGCPECLADIPLKAKKCMHCGSEQPVLNIKKSGQSL